MKVNPTPGPIHARYQNTQYSTQPNGITTGKKFNVNFGSRSQSFQQMNGTVINLDNMYKSLSTAQQNAWTAAAATIPDVAVCGCPSSVMDGQILSRLVNYLSDALGLPYLATPPAPGPTPQTGIIFCTRAIGANLIALQSLEASEPFYSIIQLGKGLNNPTFGLITPPSVITLAPGDKYFDTLWNTKDNASGHQCVWDAGLWPRGQTTIVINTTP